MQIIIVNKIKFLKELTVYKSYFYDIIEKAEKEQGVKK